MHANPAFVAHGEPAKSVQPGQRALNDPTRATQAAAVRRPALGELGVDPALVKRIAMRLRIISAVTPDETGFAQGPPGTAAQRRNGIDQRQQLCDVVSVRAGEHRRQRDAACLGENVMFRPRLTANRSVQESR